MKIYLLEDDESIRKLVSYTLEHAEYEPRSFERPSELYGALREEVPGLLLLDIMLPEEDGLTVLRRIRETGAWRNLPVVMMTAKNAEYDRVIGLDSGADDYITKPFGMMELLARIRAVLRRTERTVPPESDYTIGNLTLSPEGRTVTVDGKNVELTYKEFELLSMLMKHRGTVLTRDVIMDCVWGDSFDGENRTVDVHIRMLRSKLGTAGEHIRTVRGVGYKLEETV